MVHCSSMVGLGGACHRTLWIPKGCASAVPNDEPTKHEIFDARTVIDMTYVMKYLMLGQ